MNILKLNTQNPFEDWVRHTCFPFEGLIGCGWTSNNQILLISHDKYVIYDSKRFDKLIEIDGHPYDKFSSDNLDFIVKESEEQVKIFGLFGGNGNCVSEDGWKLEVIYPNWPNAVVLIRKPDTRGLERWEGLRLVELELLEYVDLKCGFSRNQEMFMISGHLGVEVFIRRK